MDAHDIVVIVLSWTIFDTESRFGSVLVQNLIWKVQIYRKYEEKGKTCQSF